MIRRLFVLCACVLAGCFGSEGQQPTTPTVDLGDPVSFTFGALDGQELSSDTTRGRTTVLLFVTTYDLPSQAQAQIVGDVVASHKPRANAAVVMLEPPRSAPLAQVWRDSLGLQLPVAMASPSLLAGDSQLGRIAGVPTTLVLDRRGRLVVRVEGPLTREQLKAALVQTDGR